MIVVAVKSLPGVIFNTRMKEDRGGVVVDILDRQSRLLGSILTAPEYTYISRNTISRNIF